MSFQTFNSTPRADRFWMPGEFEPHAGCWMLWPERTDVWRDDAAPAQQAFAAVASAIAQFEPVTMGVLPRDLEKARALLPGNIKLVPFEYNDAWMRDNGPTFVRNADGVIRGIDWVFNAWGGLYADWKNCDALAEKVLAWSGLGRYNCDIVMEGGAIDVDGEGTLIVTEQCLLHPNRNPALSKQQIEQTLRDYLNVDKVIWLKNGTVEDETNGHVDNLCCFVRPTVVALTWTDDESDPQHEISHDAYERLSAETDAKGRPLTVHKVHQPKPMYITEDEASGVELVEQSHVRPVHQRMSGSYINYYVANGGVVVPQFDDPNDQRALDTLQELFPNRTIVGVPSREILLGGGNIHCITQQIPGMVHK